MSFSSHIHTLMVDCDMTTFCLPCPEIGAFAHTFEPMEIIDGRWITHSFYFADSVHDCLRKQAAMHRWDCDSRGVVENEYLATCAVCGQRAPEGNRCPGCRAFFCDNHYQTHLDDNAQFLKSIGTEGKACDAT